MDKIQWKVEGMDCTNCALTIRKYLEKQGLSDVRVNFGTGDVSFAPTSASEPAQLSKGLKDLGYTVTGEGHSHGHDHQTAGIFRTHLQRFWFCLPFTLLLMTHMIPGIHIHWLMNPYVQLALTIPVFIVGMSFFGGIL